MGEPGIFVTPGTVLDYLNEVNALYTSTDLAIKSQTTFGPAGGAPPSAPASAPLVLLASWEVKLREWKKFFDDHQGFFDRLSGGVADTTERFERDCVEFRAQFERVGISMAGAPYAPNRKPPDVGDTLLAGSLSVGVAFAATAAILLLLKK
ncbi:MAG: hypothetical protein IPK82_23275 [Polyangiaceae bacterium]|nr:hypothetical protein [Polyangiaceae bacterium]